MLLYKCSKYTCLSAILLSFFPLDLYSLRILPLHLGPAHIHQIGSEVVDNTDSNIQQDSGMLKIVE